ncbi:MAG: metal ABC transporter permease [Planctomycetota bacterium]
MNLVDLLGDYTFRTVLIGTMSIGGVSGAIGCFAYLRRQSLVGDVVSHSSLLGVMVFFLISYWLTGEGSKSLFILIPGAMIAGIAALSLTRFIVSQTSVRDDSGLGVMLAIFFGTGILLLRWVQKTNPPIPGRRGLQDYLFGMAASLTQNDLVMITIVGVSSLAVMLLFWKELKVYAFDPLLAQSLGFRTKLLEVLLIGIIVNGIVIGIQCIGVVLMIAMLVTPAAAARQWTNLLGPMVSLAAAIGALCGMVGSVVSAEFSNIPTGPVIVLTGVAIFIFSILCSPSRGMLFQKWKQAKSLRNSGSTRKEAE